MNTNIKDESLELADFKESANTYYQELTKAKPIKGIGSHEHIYFTYGVEWAFNRLFKFQLQKAKDQIVIDKLIEALKDAITHFGELSITAYSSKREYIKRVEKTLAEVAQPDKENNL